MEDPSARERETAEAVERVTRQALEHEERTHFYGDGHDHGLPFEAALARGEEVGTVTFTKQPLEHQIGQVNGLFDEMDAVYGPPQPWNWKTVHLAALSDLGAYLTEHHAAVLREVMSAGGDLAQAALQVLTDDDQRLESVRAEEWPV